MSFDINFMLVALKAALKATPTSILLAVVPFIVGVIIGTLLAVARLFKIKILGRLAQIYVVVIRGIPIVLLLLMLFFAVNHFWDAVAIKYHWKLRAKNINSIYIALTALSLYAVASLSEVVRGSLAAVGKGQFEAGYSVGLTKTQTLLRIIIPQALPVAVPMFCSSIVGLIKGSSLAYMLGVLDLYNAAIITANTNYKYLEVYVAAAIIYWALTIFFEKLSYVLEKSMTKHLGRGVV